jgi:hypothetical protein
LLAAGEAAGVLAAGDAAALGDGSGVGVGVAAGAGALSGVDCNTEREPVNVGSDSVSATNMNADAAPIVIFANRLAVPRGPNAVLDTLLENNAPASALPGCNNTTTISTTQDRMNKPYRK